MNFEPIRYDQVKVGDVLFIKTEANKKGEPQKVIKVENWKTSSSHLSDCGYMHKITFENADEWYGWATRTLNKVI